MITVKLVVECLNQVAKINMNYLLKKNLPMINPAPVLVNPIILDNAKLYCNGK